MQVNSNTIPLTKSTSHVVVDVVDNSAADATSTVIIKKITGEIIATAFDKGIWIHEKVSPFDRFIIVLEGSAEIIIDKKPNKVVTGSAIIIPAHISSSIECAPGCFKIMQTIIK